MVGVAAEAGESAVTAAMPLLHVSSAELQEHAALSSSLPACRLDPELEDLLPGASPASGPPVGSMFHHATTKRAPSHTRTDSPSASTRSPRSHGFVLTLSPETDLHASERRPSEASVAAFKAAGYTEQQLLFVLLAVAVKTISNHSNHMFDTQLDAAFQGRAWQPPR